MKKRKQGPIFPMNTNETILNKILCKMNAEYIKIYFCIINVLYKIR